MIAVAELTQTIPFQLDEDEIVPKQIGFCSNSTSRLEICGRSIFEDDIEMVELERKGKRRVFVCGKCVEKLLQLSPHIPEPEKASMKSGKGWKSSKGPRLPKGEDL